MDWTLAIKVGGPVALAVWGFCHLVVEYIEKSTIFKDDFWLNVIILTYIFVFFLVVAWWLKKPGAAKAIKKIHDNKISGNEVEGDLNARADSVTNNKFEKNKVGGSLNIGE